jgi:pilus assembly protein FimV
MKTAVRRVLLLSALMSPGALYALGLGDIKLNSALNQPFDAEIELVSATQEDLGALRAALAPGDTFTRYGLDRPSYLSEFVFRVAKGAGGKDVLRVTSPKPVTEPFVTLLVEANWPRGRLLREYTVLLDPPVFAPAPTSTEAVTTPRVNSPAATSSSANNDVAAESSTAAPPAPPTPRAPRESVAPVASSVEPGSTYRVRPNDTLWRIASGAHPGTRSAVNRAMVSIYQNNPEAFDGNINVLRSGSLLRIPTANQVQSISAAEASAEVARQYDAWRSGAAQAGRLRLVTPEQGTAAPSTAVTSPAAAPAGTAAAPAATRPGAAAADANLEARVKQLEGELAEAKRLLEVRNAELATLQGGAAAAAPGVTTPASSAAPATTETAAPATTPAAAPTPAAEAPAPAAQATPKPAPKPKPETAPAEPAGPSLLERITDYWWVLLGLLAAALGFALFQRMRRERGSAEENLEEALGSRDMRSTTTTTYTPRSRESDIVVEEKRAAPTTASVTPIGAAAPRAAEAQRKTSTVEDTLSGDAPGSTESGDPLAEADFHMAYGLYDQAADLVQLAIKREPQRRDLKLKLLEIFFVWGNRDRFMELARELNASRAQAPAGEWDKVLIMGKQIAPGDAMFAGAPTSGDSLDMELHGAATSLDLDLASGTPASDVGDEHSRTNSSGIDFILDEPLRNAAAGGDVAPTIETPRVRPDESALAPTIETPRVSAGGDTQEVTVDRLGLDVDSLRELEALDADAGKGGEASAKVDDTVETTSVGTGDSHSLLDSDDDLLSTASMLNMADSTAVMKADDMEEEGVIDLSDATGELPSLEDDLNSTSIRRAPDYDLAGEPATMSEVGTKLDLARAYMDMGDPEGARSILDEVLQEGTSVQRQEAERLISSLP